MKWNKWYPFSCENQISDLLTRILFIEFYYKLPASLEPYSLTWFDFYMILWRMYKTYSNFQLNHFLVVVIVIIIISYCCCCLNFKEFYDPKGSLWMFYVNVNAEPCLPILAFHCSAQPQLVLCFISPIIIIISSGHRHSIIVTE